MKRKQWKTTERLITVGVVAVVFLAWYGVTQFGIVSAVLVPTPKAVWTAFLDILQNGYKGYTLWQHLAASMQRLAIAFVWYL